MNTYEQLITKLTTPTEALIQDLAKIDGDIMLLGVGGKMGPTLAGLAVNAIREGGLNKKVIGVSRFSDQEARKELDDIGVQTIACDLLDDIALQALPHCNNIIYMAGNKFGTTGREYFTWAMNSYLPGRVAEKFKDSRIVVFSSGNIYPFVPVSSGGADESVEVQPIGEYAQSTLGRERIFEYHSHKNGTPMTMYRLNYAVDMRYGVLLELAKSVNEGRAVDLTTGFANVIWQGDANSMALRCLNHTSTPPTIMNITGPEVLSIRWAAEQFGKRLNKEVQFINKEADIALLNNATKSHKVFGYPQVGLLQMIDWTAEWIQASGKTWNKPTHFQERGGKF